MTAVKGILIGRQQGGDEARVNVTKRGFDAGVSTGSASGN